MDIFLEIVTNPDGFVFTHTSVRLGMGSLHKLHASLSTFPWGGKGTAVTC